MTKRILVIAAHPDDELLGCGGTIALHTRAGDHVTALIACEGESVRYGTAGVGMASHTEQAAAVLGVQDVRALGLADQRLDTMAMLDIVVALERVVRDVQPHIVYAQYGGDANFDHQILFKALLVATRPLSEQLEGVYAFDTASSTEWGYPRTFAPDTWIDISSTLDQKLAAMACYESEVRPYPHPRSLDALRHRAKAWGNQVCMDAAEVFMTVRRTMRNGQAPD
jgi:N-acetylglucosamine malate deacetylase 1